MQVTASDSGCRVGVAEKYIKFRPSPNFKNMKKFLKSKIDNEEISNASPPNTSSPPNPTSPTPSIKAKEKKEKVKPEPEQIEKRPLPIQPPLPLDPPPVSPPISIKKEIEELENDLADPEADLENQIQQLKTEIKTDPMEDTKKKKKPICRDFLRGTCSRMGSCKYIHEYDISQLVGVYTFCRNYQNSKCTYPNCKYVHASVFEEQKFYRTGVLPPHAMSHKKVTMLPPPPPPPPEEPPKLDIPTDFSNPPPSLLTGGDKTVPVIIAPPPNIEITPPETISVASPSRAVAHSPRDYDPNELAKTCSRCEWLEFSLQYNKDMVDKMIKTIEEDKNMMTHLTNKSQKLYTILHGFLKSTVKTPMLSNMTNYDLNSDKENHLWDRLSKYFGSQTRITLPEDPNKYKS